ncbi:MULTISPECIES: TrmB family transcriptional regulator [unclassified Lysinibacillus]|uniref:TrmB family transcriptional regulator n=1 Tax=unclassified Lysinibacillus TaxID=2636778 RepID=UPI00255698BB|nr:MULTISPECIES: TrmB family transcriptional regulator [unclassified Lysinibacillus]MDM5248506.1 helix-turn-helix domain-containing protein [Lysinibacillus sp. G4S2]
MDELIAQLKELGFTEYEAKAYTALVQNSHVSAYQVSKNSGIPRARIYDILDLLVEKGLVLKEETTDQTTYSSIPVAVFLQQIQQSWQSNFTSISTQLEKLETKEQETEHKVLMLKGKQAIVNYCQSLLKKAEKKVLLSMWEDMYEELREDIHEVNQHTPVHGITLYVDENVASIDQHRITQYTRKASTPHWFILSVDGQEMIYGHSPSNQETAFITTDPVQIYLLEDYIWHDVLVNRLLKRDDKELEEWITKERKAFFLD